MKRIIDCLKKYIDDEVLLKNWNNEAKKRFSLEIASSFNFYLLNLLQTEFILLEPLEEYTAEKLEKDLHFIESKTQYSCVFAFKSISSYMIKRFLKDKIAFVIEDNQLSIPFLALKLRMVLHEKRMINSIERFTPLNQLVYLYLLYSEEKVFSINDLSNKLNISVMSILRAMNNFENLGLVYSDIGGATNRKKIYYKIEQEKFYEVGKRYLNNPVKKVLYVSNIPENIKIFKSDLTALSKKTMLAETKRKIYAIYQNEEILKSYLVSEEIAKDNNLPIIQLMKYDISLLTNDDCVDPITLIESLKDNDERIKSGIKYALLTSSYNGNLCVKQENLEMFLEQNLDVSSSEIENNIINLKVKEEIVVEEREDESRWVYLYPLYKVEKNICERLFALKNFKNMKFIKNFEKDIKSQESLLGIKLSEKQYEAINQINDNNVSIITGRTWNW